MPTGEHLVPEVSGCQSGDYLWDRIGVIWILFLATEVGLGGEGCRKGWGYRKESGVLGREKESVTQWSRAE